MHGLNHVMMNDLLRVVHICLKCPCDEKMLFSFSFVSDLIFGKNPPCLLLHLNFENKSDFLNDNFSF